MRSSELSGPYRCHTSLLNSLRGSGGLLWIPGRVIKYIDLIQKVSQIFHQLNGFIEEQHIATQNVQSWQAMFKSTKAKERTLFYRREEEIGKAITNKKFFLLCYSIMWGMRAPLSPSLLHF